MTCWRSCSPFLRLIPLRFSPVPWLSTSAATSLFDGGTIAATLYNEFLQHSTLTFRFPNGRWTSQPYLSRWDHLSTRQVESVLGACMLIRADLFHSTGGFDENFFLYAEEQDLCHRLRTRADKSGTSFCAPHAQGEAKYHSAFRLGWQNRSPEYARSSTITFPSITAVFQPSYASHDRWLSTCCAICGATTETISSTSSGPSTPGVRNV